MADRCRVMLRSGPSFVIEQDPVVIARCVRNDEWLDGYTVTGQALFPPEWTAIRCEDVTYVQAISTELWAWQQQADAKHYARTLADSPEQTYADAVKKMAEHFGEHEDE